MAGKGYITHRTTEVTSTVACEDETEPHLNPPVSSRAANLRKAQLAISVVVSLGILPVDFNEIDWQDSYKAAVLAVARAFDAVDVKI